MIKIQIKSIFGNVLFEYEKENNTQRETILEAVKSRANLSRADLTGANLSRANLSGAYLSRAGLTRADLSGANLSGADLSRAYLSRANLSRADLSGANLSRADLTGADLTRANLSRADLTGAYLTNTFIQPYCKWQVGMKNDLIKIGCKEKSIDDWDLFFASNEEFSTKRGTKEFAMIQANYEAVKSYKLFMEKFLNGN